MQTKVKAGTCHGLTCIAHGPRGLQGCQPDIRFCAASVGFISTLVAELPQLLGTLVPPFHVTALAAKLRASCLVMALLDTFRYVNFIREEKTQNSTEGKNAGGILRFNGEATRLGEYTWRVCARMAREAEMDTSEVKKQGPRGFRLVEAFWPRISCRPADAPHGARQQGGRGETVGGFGFLAEAATSSGGSRALRGGRARRPRSQCRPI